MQGDFSCEQPFFAFERGIAMASMAEEVIAYIAEAYGAQPEYPWAKSPGNGIFRHRENRKWFAALILNISKERIGLEGEEIVDILNLKCDPLLMEGILDGRSRLPGYHMNKKHWISILLDGSVGMGEIASLIDMSHGLTQK